VLYGLRDVGVSLPRLALLILFANPLTHARDAHGGPLAMEGIAG